MVKQNPFSQALAEVNNRTQDAVTSSDSTTDKPTASRGGLREDFSTALSKAQSVVSKPSLPPPPQTEKVSLGTRIRDTTRGIGNRISGFFDLALSKKQQSEGVVRQNVRDTAHRTAQEAERTGRNLATGIIGAVKPVLDFISFAYTVDKDTMNKIANTKDQPALLQSIFKNYGEVQGSRGELTADVAKEVKKLEEKIAVKDPNTIDQVVQAFGSTLAYFVAGIASGGPFLPTLLETYGNMGEVVKRTEGRSLEDRANRVVLNGAVNGVYNYFSNKFGLLSTEKLGLRKLFSGFLSEGTQEGTQALMGNVTSTDAWGNYWKKLIENKMTGKYLFAGTGPFVKDMFQGVKESALIGGLMGTMFSLVDLSPNTQSPAQPLEGGEEPAGTAQTAPVLTKSADNVPTSPKAGVKAGAIAKVPAPLEKEGTVSIEPATYNEAFNEAPVEFESGDLVVDTNGAIKEVVRGNDKWISGANKDSPQRDVNIGYLRTKRIGETEDYIDYANQLRKLTEREVATVTKTEKEPSAKQKTTEPTEGIKLYRGSKGVVTEETKTFNNVLEVEGYQPQLLQKLADEGNADAQSLLDQAQGRKVDFVSADRLIREAYKDSYDAIKYDNTTDNRKAVGIEYHDLRENRFYAEQKDTAQSYALQSRGLKYDENIEKTPSTIKAKTLASIRQERKPSDIKSSKIKSPEELSELIDELNKFGQKYAILRRASNIKKAYGAFERKGKSDVGEVLIRSTNSDREYLDSISHELGHAIENGLTGTTNKKTFEVFGDISNDLKNTIEGELLDVTKSLVGEGAFLSDTNYYSRPTELLARFFEMYITNPELLASKAPNALEAITKQSVVHPMIREYLEVIEKKARLKDKIGFRFLPDLRETYQKALKSKRLGNIVYHEEVVHRSLVALAKKELSSFIETKFKGIKDSPEQLFRVAESIRVTRNGIPEFGTRDMVETKSEKQARDLEEAGFKLALKETVGGEAVMTYTRQRYTEVEAKELYNNLSEEGKQLIEDFTSSIEEAKDFFNREVIKDVYKIESNIEGWVHHYFEKSTTTASNANKFKLRKAGAKKQRTNKEGYVEDLQKAMTKALVDLQGETLFNDFITRQFARVSKPILEGKNPDAGWVEVVGRLERGVGTRAEKAQTIIVDGKVMTPKQTRYQIPKDIYERYKLIREVTDEASLATRVVQNINKYWAVNILFHTGTAGTNFLGGGLQFSSKVLTDFYKELLTGSVAFDSTRKNIGSMLSTLLPKGWLKTPDWVYGADLSNWYGQFMSNDKGVANKTLDAYGDKALKLFSTYERYWKKVISLSEDSMYLSNLGKVGKRGLRLPTDEERRILESVNDAVDLYAFDYDNIPLWLSKMKRNPLGSAVKPFATYPYKYAKHITNMAGAVFDRSLPMEDRLSKLMALTTIMALYGAFSYDRKKKQQTPDATSPEIEIRAKAAGYVFTGFTDKDGNELFVRISKYPYFGLTEAGIQLLRGNTDAANNIMDEMIGSTGPLFNIALTLKGYSNEYNKYDSMSIKLGDTVSSFIPATRILRDISNALDPYKRKQKTFTQKITSLVPTKDPELQEKLHGSIRTVKIPIEGDIKRKIGTPYTRTTVDKELRNYWQDILLSALTGVYIKRVNPKDVEAQIIRDEKNKKKNEE